MKLWLDAHISPALARWISAEFTIPASPVRELGLRDAKDREIFLAAREADAVVITKDIDFVHMLRQHGPPPRVIWLRCGNTSNARLRDLLFVMLPRAIALIEAGEVLVEIAGWS